MAKQKFYVVWEGVTPGVYTSWTDCQLQIKGYEGAKYKSFDTREEAERALASSPYAYIGKNAKVHYIEKHYGEGEGSGKRILNPQTIVYLEEGASIVMDTSQIGGVDDTKRYTKCEANGANSEVQINEKLLTAGDQHAVSEMDVILNGEGSRTRVVSRSVAKEASTQIFYPRVQGNAPCFGHVSCDSIIMGAAKVRSIPEISCNHVDAALMHEAAIGKIAGEQLLKLETLGLTPEEAEEKILEGFLR